MLFCLFLPIAVILPSISCQFVYPRALNGSLTDYTSGKIISALNFSAGDDLLGSWSTPVGLSSFFLLRCTHTPSSTPIYPTNSSFNSSMGYISPEDGTWLQMPLFSDGMFGNGYNSGSNIFYAPDFFQGNETTGPMCWFELYPGDDSQAYSDLDNGTSSAMSAATVDGNGPWYFASEPFVVKPRRPTGQMVTWRDDGTERGVPTRKLTGGSNGTSAGDGSSATQIVGGADSSASARAGPGRNAGGKLQIGHGAWLYWMEILCIAWILDIAS